MLDILIGEKLNSSVLTDFNEENLLHLIKSQELSGADYLDVNTVMCDNELDMIIHIVDLILEQSNCGIVIDSSNADVITETAAYIKNRSFILNSITMSERIDTLIPVAVKYNCGIIAMPIDTYGVSISVDDRLKNADILINRLLESGVDRKNIIIDMVVESLSTNYESAVTTLNFLKQFKLKYLDIKTLCGISNISYGLPDRPKINAAFLSTAIYQGLNCAILDITSPEINSAIHLSNLLNGDDEYCMDYINYIRSYEI